MKITNAKKFIKSLLLILGMVLAVSLLISKATLSHKEIEYKTIYVSEGDTLWDIAQLNQVNNEYYKNKDIRYIINDLIKINNLNNSNIKVDQEILIPVI